MADLETVHATLDHTGISGVGASVPAAHGCRVKRASGDFSIGNNTDTAVAFTAEDYDTDTMHDNSSNTTRITIPSISGVTTGLWRISASGYITGGTLASVAFRIGGSTVIAFNRNNDGTVGTYELTTDYVLSATNYIECLVKCPTGSASVVHDPGISPLFSVAFLGKVT